MENLLTLPISGYLREWLVHAFGMPARFPARSFENAIICRGLVKPPAHQAVTPSRATEDAVHIVAPVCHGKPFASYNILSRKAQSELIEAIEILFRLDLYHSLMPQLAKPGINDAIDGWCKSRGISLQFREGVRQKFYRIRKDYRSCGIFLGKKYKT